MPWDPALDRLQAILANLYSRDADIRRVAASAGLDAAFIDFDGPAIDVWHQVLSEALRRNRVKAVIAVAQREYSDNEELAAAAKAFHAGNGAGAPSPTPAIGPRRWLTARAWLAIGAGVLVVAIIGVLTLRPPAAAPGPTATLTPSATATVPPPTRTPAPSATWTPAQPTPFPTVTFLSMRVIDQPDDLTPAEYHPEPGVLPSETITDFLRMNRMEWGTLVEPQGEVFALSFNLALKNTNDHAILLDLNQHFFSLVDEQGRAGELAYFCCATHGEFLAPGRQREMVLIYRANSAWGGKHSPNNAVLEVHGLLPVLSAAWSVPLPVTAE